MMLEFGLCKQLVWGHSRKAGTPWLRLDQPSTNGSLQYEMPEGVRALTNLSPWPVIYVISEPPTVGFSALANDANPVFARHVGMGGAVAVKWIIILIGKFDNI
jgi:hypothetical protein